MFSKFNFSITKEPVEKTSKCLIRGNAETVDNYVKRAAIFNRNTLELLSIRNVEKDNTFELYYAPDIGDGEYLLTGLDEGGNFNVDGEDRLSLGLKTYTPDPEIWKGASGNSQAFLKKTRENVFKPLKENSPFFLDAAAQTYQSTAGMFVKFTDTGIFLADNSGEIKNIPVKNKIDKNSNLKILDKNFNISKISKNKLFMDIEIERDKNDILGDNSCILNSPLRYFFHDYTENYKLMPNSVAKRLTMFRFFGGSEIETDFIPFSDTAYTFSFHINWTYASGYEFPIFQIHNRFEIGFYSSSLYVRTTGGTSLSSRITSSLSPGEYFFCVIIDDKDVSVFIDDMAAVKLSKTASVTIFDNFSPFIIGGVSSAKYNTSMSARLKDFRIFNKALTQTEREFVQNNTETETEDKILPVTSVSNFLTEDSLSYFFEGEREDKAGIVRYEIAANVYFIAGDYYLIHEAYDKSYEAESWVEIRNENNSINIVDKDLRSSSEWKYTDKLPFTIPEEGFYTIYGRGYSASTNHHWGVANLSIKGKSVKINTPSAQKAITICKENQSELPGFYNSPINSLNFEKTDVFLTENILLTVNKIEYKIPATQDITLINQPCAIDLSKHQEVFNFTNFSNFGIIFETGEILPAEIESFSQDAKKGLIWFTLPYISDKKPTYYALIYTDNQNNPYLKKNTGTTEDEITCEVWKDYSFVYHMNNDPEGTEELKDSTANRFSGTTYNMTAADKSFSLLSSYEYEFDGTAYADLGNIITTPKHQGTLETVFKTTQTQSHILTQDAEGRNNRDTILSIGKPTGVANPVTDGFLSFESTGPGASESKQTVSAIPVNDGNYHYAAVTWYKDKTALIIDDLPQVTQDSWESGHTTETFTIGSAQESDFFNGTIYELIIGTKFRTREFTETFNKSLNDSLINYTDNTITSQHTIENIPVLFNLTSSCGTNSTDMTHAITPDFTKIEIKVNETPCKTEKVIWEEGVTARLFALIPLLSAGENTISITTKTETNPLVGEIGSFIGKEIWADYEAVFHLAQKPSDGIKDSTSNHTPILSGIDNTNIDSYGISLNGTDQKIEIPGLFTQKNLRAEIHTTFKTAAQTGTLISSGSTIKLGENTAGFLTINNPDSTLQEESTTAVNTSTKQTLSFNFETFKRELYINGTDQIPYYSGYFGSDGNSSILIGKHYEAGTTFQGNIADLRLASKAKTQESCILTGKMWKEILSTQSDEAANIHIYPSFNKGNTYKIFNGTHWIPVVTKEDTIHGTPGDTDYYYLNNSSQWIKENDLFEAFKTVSDTHKNKIEYISTLTSQQWTASGGITSQGFFEFALAYTSTIKNLYKKLDGVYPENKKIFLSETTDLEEFNQKISDSIVQWAEKITDKEYDYSQIEVQSCITGSTWQNCTRNQAIPEITEAMETTGKKLRMKMLVPKDFPEDSGIYLQTKIK